MMPPHENLQRPLGLGRRRFRWGERVSPFCNPGISSPKSSTLQRLSFIRSVHRGVTGPCLPLREAGALTPRGQVPRCSRSDRQVVSEEHPVQPGPKVPALGSCGASQNDLAGTAATTFLGTVYVQLRHADGVFTQLLPWPQGRSGIRREHTSPLGGDASQKAGTLRLGGSELPSFGQWGVSLQSPNPVVRRPELLEGWMLERLRDGTRGCFQSHTAQGLLLSCCSQDLGVVFQVREPETSTSRVPGNPDPLYRVQVVSV